MKRLFLPGRGWREEKRDKTNIILITSEKRGENKKNEEIKRKDIRPRRAKAREMKNENRKGCDPVKCENGTRSRDRIPKRGRGERKLSFLSKVFPLFFITGLPSSRFFFPVNFSRLFFYRENFLKSREPFFPWISPLIFSWFFPWIFLLVFHGISRDVLFPYFPGILYTLYLGIAISYSMAPSHMK